MAASLDQRGADTPARMCPSHRERADMRPPLEGVGPELGILGRQGATADDAVAATRD
ncbi:hypothetical protein ECZU28_39790 [Escherichia coli]|nr:hypothetical protein ECZU28_39790 [Escherichia coli]